MKSAQIRRFFARSEQDCKASARVSGFTIIEVALVLAIAGLIFLVVFLPLPALQRSQRDTARRQDVAKAVAAIRQFYADGGDATTIPANPSFSKTVGDSFDKVPVLGAYLLSAGLSSNMSNARVWTYDVDNRSGCNHASDSGPQALDIFVGCKCDHKDNGQYFLSVGTPRDIAVETEMEAGYKERASQNSYCATAGD